MAGKGLKFSAKQLRVLTWWQDPKWEAVICDGAVRSGKTFAMGLSFFLWAQAGFDGKQFGVCGKTIASVRRNLLSELAPVLRRLGMEVRERRGENLLAVRFRGHENRFLLFGGRDESSAALIQGSTLAGVLLDEAALMPRSFVEQAVARCTLAEILQNHAEPYGITCGEIAEVRAASAYTVAAGSSQWKAVESFCRACGGFVPRFSREGELLASPEQAGRTLSIGEGDPVLSCTLREDHYGVLTEALVIDKTQNQEFSVKNQEMIDKGGQCRRVLYTPGQSTWAAMRYTGEYQIQRSGEDAWTAEVTLPGSFLAFPGDRVSLSLERMGLSGTFRVAEAENRFDGGNGALVTLTLKPLKT